MKRLLLALLMSLMVFSATGGWAEEKIKIGEVVVTASKIEESAEETTSEVTVIRAEEIKKMNAVSVSDVLRKVPDLNLVQSGGDGNLAFVFLRGGAPRHTLVMIDGVKVNSNTSGGFDFYRLQVNDIERIEIVKGSQSTIYGSEAMAGVINIITKKGEGKPRIETVLEGGSFGTYKPSLNISGSYNTLNYHVTTFYYHTDGISAAKNGQEKDGFNNAFLSWNFGYKPADTFELELNGNYSNDRTELDGFDLFTGKPTDALNFVQHGNHFLLSARGKLLLLNRWEQVLTLSTFSDILKSRDPETEFNNSDFKTGRQFIDWQNNFYLTDAATLTAGLEYRNDAGRFSNVYDETVDNKAAYLNTKVKLLKDALIINAGLRYDDHEKAGSKTTYKIGAAYNIKEAGLLIRTSYGTGFLAPTFDFLFFEPFNNPNLKPEESKSFEAGVTKTFLNERLSVSVTYFNEDYKNLIQGDPANNFRASNIAKASAEGVEALATMKIADALELKAGYTYLDAKDTASGEPLLRRPNNKFNLGIGYTNQYMSALADLIYVGERHDIDGFTVVKVSPYYLVNLSGSYRATKDITLFGRIENMLDKDYEDPKGFGTKGISAYGGVRLAL